MTPGQLAALWRCDVQQVDWLAQRGKPCALPEACTTPPRLQAITSTTFGSKPLASRVSGPRRQAGNIAFKESQILLPDTVHNRNAIDRVCREGLEDCGMVRGFPSHAGGQSTVSGWDGRV